MNRVFFLIAAVCAAVAFGGCSRGPGPQPNVVLITIDTLRADRLGCYGYFRDTTPNLDALAREALLFERCYAPIATTFPSHFALLTGRHPLEIGAVANVTNTRKPFVPSENLQSLAQLLSAAGYRSRAAVSATPLKRHTGLFAGFERYDEPKGMERPASATTEVALRWLPEMTDGPFFLWAHYYDPHDSYKPPKPYDEMWNSDEEQERYLAEREFQEAFNQYQRELSMRDLNDLYDGEISFTDAAVGRLFSALRDAGVWDETVVIVVGDHGEAMGQHNKHSHGDVWLEQLRVPLLIRVPGVRPKRIERLLGMRDVLPTLLEFVDLPCQDAVRQQATGTNRMRSEGETYLVGQESGAPWKRKDSNTLYSLIGEQWRLVHNPRGEDLLFRLPEDPHELSDVAQDHPEVLQRLRSLLLERLAGLTEGVTPGAQTQAIDPKVLEEMEALGYVE